MNEDSFQRLNLKETIQILSECPIKIELLNPEWKCYVLYVFYKNKWLGVCSTDLCQQVCAWITFEKNNEGDFGTYGVDIIKVEGERGKYQKNWMEPTEYCIHECVKFAKYYIDEFMESGASAYLYDDTLAIIDAITDG